MLSNQDKELILKNEYHQENFLWIVDNLMTDFVRSTHDVDHSSRLFESVVELGESKSCELTVFQVQLRPDTQRRRVKITQDMFRILNGLKINNAFVSFVNSDNLNYRISLLTSKYEWQDDNIIKTLSNPRRYSYSLGHNTKTKTAHDYLIKSGKVENLAQLLGRFSVEVVNKEFYNKIATQFTRLVGGNRGKDGQYKRLLSINSVVDNNKYAEFAVRLIGRIVFCWFLKEKKSSRGLPLVSDNLLSHSAIQAYPSYYHNVLEPLFFEILNTKTDSRQDKFATDAIYTQIPYLNGGLFSPHNDDHYKYDRYTQSGSLGIIDIPDSWFDDLYTVLDE